MNLGTLGHKSDAGNLAILVPTDAGSGRMFEEEDPDHPARQDEVANRLMAYAAKLRAEGGQGEGDEGESRDEDERDAE